MLIGLILFDGIVCLQHSCDTYTVATQILGALVPMVQVCDRFFQSFDSNCALWYPCKCHFEHTHTCIAFLKAREQDVYTMQTGGGIPASSLWGSLGLTPIKNFLRPDLLDVLLLEPGGSKFFNFRKKKFNCHVMYASRVIDHVIHARAFLKWLTVCGSVLK